MGDRIFIITGTSKGIGRQLAELCLEKGDSVYGIARGASDLGNIYEGYTHVQFDLKDIHGIDDVISGILEQIPLLSVECIGLINNAAMLEPLKPIDQCLADEISVHLNILVDTELQAVARGKSTEEFALSGAFRDAYELGQLKSPHDVALEILKLLEGAKE